MKFWGILSNCCYFFVLVYVSKFLGILNFYEWLIEIGKLIEMRRCNFMLGSSPLVKHSFPFYFSSNEWLPNFSDSAQSTRLIHFWIKILCFGLCHILHIDFGPCRYYLLSCIGMFYANVQVNFLVLFSFLEYSYL